jgi:hypothetical protein
MIWAMATTANARAALEAQTKKIARLRGTGPNPFEYDMWQARSLELLCGIYGAESAEVAQYEEATGVRGRLPGVRGQAGNMTLNIHGDWGILGRLERGEVVLNDLVSRAD